MGGSEAKQRRGVRMQASATGPQNEKDVARQQAPQATRTAKSRLGLAFAACLLPPLFYAALLMRQQGATAHAFYSGGWQTDANAIEEFGATCSMGQLPMRRPFVLSVRNLSARAAFTRDELLSTHGTSTVQVGTSTSIVGSKLGHGDERWSLADALAAMRDKGKHARRASTARTAGNPIYVFDRNNLLPHASRLMDAVESLLGGVLRVDVPRTALYLAVGESHSGTQWHKHGEGWNLQIFGHKHWLLLPPEKIPVDAGIPFPPQGELSVLTTVRRMHSADLIQCTVGPGEVLFIPEGYHHATLNLGEGVGVAGQVKQPLTRVQQALERGNAAHGRGAFAEAADAYAEAAKEMPEAADTWYVLGLVNGKRGRYAASAAAFVRALYLEPRLAAAWSSLAYCLRLARLPLMRVPLLARGGSTISAGSRTLGRRARHRVAAQCEERSRALKNLPPV